MSKTINLPFRHDIPLADQCGHGKLWTEFCRDCRIVWLEHGLDEREQQCKRDRAELEHLRGQGMETPVALKCIHGKLAYARCEDCENDQMGFQPALNR